MADYWIKLYIEILDDPKMAILPDRLWRRCIELFLLAGKFGVKKDGNLPDTRQIAWLLRMSTDELASDLQQLSSTGIIEPIPNGWHVVNFARRQAAVSDLERQKQHRNRAKNEQYNGEVTNTSRNVTQKQINRNRLTETETDSARDKSDPFFAMQAMVERLTGYPSTQNDIKPLNEFIERGIQEQDLKAALTFLDGKKIVRGAADLRNSAFTALSKRVQAAARHAPVIEPSEEFGR